MNENNFYPEGSSTPENQRSHVFTEWLTNNFKGELTPEKQESLIKAIRASRAKKINIFHSIHEKVEGAFDHLSDFTLETYSYNPNTNKWQITIKHRKDKQYITETDEETISAEETIKRLKKLPSDARVNITI